MGSNNIPGKEDAVAGDILCAKANGSKKIFKSEDYTDISGSGWTPIGVVVIPPSHDVYGTGEGAAISFKYAYYGDPDNGSNFSSFMFGSNYTDITLNSYTFVSVISPKNTSTKIEPDASLAQGYLPSDKYKGGSYPSLTDSDAGYAYVSYGSRYFIPSPYDNGYKSIYYSYPLDTNESCMSDFDGVYNTNIFLSLATAQSDWRTASEITNYSTPGYYPVVCCCWRYHTIGTNQGDWYLPAIGELGYYFARYSIIRKTLDNFELDSEYIGHYWSSTPSNQSQVWALRNDNYGQIAHYYKNDVAAAKMYIRF